MSATHILPGIGFIACMLATAVSADTRLVFNGAGAPGANQPDSGSWFSIKVLDLDFDGDNEAAIYTPVSSDSGIVISTAQAAGIDQTWNYFGKPGNHLSQTPVTVTGAEAGTKTLDFSGWAMAWQNAVLALGADNLDETPDGVAVMECDFNCGAGEAFTLDYTANIPADSAYFPGAEYHLHLTGTIEQID